VILDLYRQLEEIATREYGDIIEETEIIFSYTGRARKLRLYLIDNTFIDIWYFLKREYSFHWEQTEIRNIVYRHDNAPHKKWAHIKTFPKHCHDTTEENVIESNLSDKPEEAIREFLSIVRGKMIKSKTD
jgi:hypothetical protein